ncbi:MAG: hypothetical protein ACI837_000188 [Crocinitomicaceae bacterium]|jgi:hypothetical protein
MSILKKSLEDNLTEIKANLAEEFHADLEKNIAATTDEATPSAEEQKASVVAALKANPDIDEAPIVAEFEASSESFIAPARMSEAETESAIQAELKNWEGQ